MGRMTEVYCCDFVPSFAPKFVDPHITVEKMGKKKVYLIEVDPNHPDAIQVRSDGGTIEGLLKVIGFRNPVCLFKGDRPY